MTMTINELLKLEPNTTLASAGISPQQLADADVIRAYFPFKGKSHSFGDIIYSNETWFVRGDATIESKGINWCNIDGDDYYIDGEHVRDGTKYTSPLHSFWPYHVCQKEWVNRKDFCNAYAIAYIHRSMMKAAADMAADDARERQNTHD